jgi:hypothetical protein
MALTLAQAAATSTNMMGRGVMEVIATSSVVLDRLPFEDIEGNAFQYYSENALPGTEFRAVNAGYTESTGSLTSATESLVILGGDADVDRYLQQTRSNLFDQRATQLTLKAKAVEAKFSDTFVNGNTGTDANAFNGIKARLTGSQLLSAATNGLTVNGSTDVLRQDFLDLLDGLIAAVPNCDVLYCNAAVLSKLRSAMRRLTIGTTQQDELGRYVDTYNGIPIVDIGNKADGTPIIPQTETQGSSSLASSIYAVHFGGGLADQGVVGLSNGGMTVMDLGQLETKPALRTRIEWYCGLALFGPRPAARLQGVLVA